MRVTFIILFFISVALFSCETFIHVQGNVFDKQTNSPIDDVRALVIFRNKDTLKDVHFDYDTVPYNKRKFVRKQGVKDNYKSIPLDSSDRYAKLVPALTDSVGYFKIGTLIVPGFTNYKVVFLKDGYSPFVINSNSKINDTLKIFLDKAQ